MFRITYRQGNGYHCSCCRSTWTETSDCDTIEEVIEWLSNLEADKVISSWEDANDREVEEIREIKDEPVILQANPDRVKELIELRKKAKEEAQAKEQARTKKFKINEDLKKLRELKAQYPEA